MQTSLPNNLCEHSEGAPHRGGAVQRTEGVCRGEANSSLFHLIVQMQREGDIRFTQLIAEKDYRWLHVSYVPGMLQSQIVNVNDDDNVNKPYRLTDIAEHNLLSTLSPKKDYHDSG